MLDKIAHLIHLLGFSAFIAAGFSQLQFMKASARVGLPSAVRDAYEGLSAAIVTKAELPALMLQVLSGVLFIVQTPGWMKMGWLHAKLTAVVVVLALSHIEMFNARAIVRLRKQRGDQAQSEIDARKKRHAMLGGAGTVAVVSVILLVTFGR